LDKLYTQRNKRKRKQEPEKIKLFTHENISFVHIDKPLAKIKKIIRVEYITKALHIKGRRILNDRQQQKCFSSTQQTCTALK
jgi:hypothetical protein